ncbi:MAG: hypothetical protein KDC95_17045 [Planctomycetes bacterium]|nr:hypothetical protein [Planctomycetota bacterium]
MSFRIFAGNLAFQVTDEDLREAFSKFGQVVFARVILDRDTGKSRGFGFVEIDGDENGKRAIEGLDGQDLKGRSLRLREAEPRGPGGGGGDRGGDRGGERRPPRPREGGPAPRGDRPRGGFGDRPDRGERPDRGPRDGGGADRPVRRSGPSEPVVEDRRRESKRRTTANDDRSRKSGGTGGAGTPHGRPAEKVRGGARNRFVHEDDEDDDIDLFGSYHEDDSDEGVDLDAIEFGSDDEERSGIDLSKLRNRLEGDD